MENIAEYLYTPKTRAELENATGFCDRINRVKIQKIRPTNPVCNLQDGNGYFIPDPNTTEGQAAIRAQHNLFLSRIFELWESDKGCRINIKDLDQITLAEMLEQFEGEERRGA